MALHTSLPIYRDAYQLLGFVTVLTKNMNRDYKVLVGGGLRDNSFKIMTLIFEANSAKDGEKVTYLDSVLERQRAIELSLRLSCDLRLISKDQYAKAIDLTSSVGRQANGWRRKYVASPAS